MMAAGRSARLQRRTVYKASGGVRPWVIHRVLLIVKARANKTESGSIFIPLLFLLDFVCSVHTVIPFVCLFYEGNATQFLMNAGTAITIYFEKKTPILLKVSDALQVQWRFMHMIKETVQFPNVFHLIRIVFWFLSFFSLYSETQTLMWHSHGDEVYPESIIIKIKVGTVPLQKNNPTRDNVMQLDTKICYYPEVDFFPITSCPYVCYSLSEHRNGMHY